MILNISINITQKLLVSDLKKKNINLPTLRCLNLADAQRELNQH